MQELKNYSVNKIKQQWNNEFVIMQCVQKLPYVLFLLAPNVKGQDGLVSASFIKSGKLDEESKQNFPVELMKVMKREAEDLLLGNNGDQKGEDALRFIVRLTKNRNDVDELKQGEIYRAGHGLNIRAKNYLQSRTLISI